jgi:hypothetical protein
MQGRVAEMRSAARALEQFKAQINVCQKQNSAYCAGIMKKDPKGSFFIFKSNKLLLYRLVFSGK